MTLGAHRLGILLVLAAVAGCSGKAAKDVSVSPSDAATDTAAHVSEPVIRLVLSELAIDSGGAMGGKDERYLGRRLGSQLLGSGLFYSSAESARQAGVSARPATLRLKLSFDVLPEGSTGSPALVVAMESSLVWSGTDVVVISENVLGELGLKTVEDGKRDGLYGAHALKTVEQVAAGLVAKERMRSASDGGLLKALAEGGDPELLAWVLSLVGERRVKGAVPAVAPFLKAGSKAVRDAAITALVTLGDAEAVDALARYAEFSDYMAVRTVIEAVSVLGGRDAAEYLDFVASGHPDPEIRARASSALARVRAAGRAEKP
jgi:hypothetical protein